jgi:hypothetical protein
MVPRRSEETDVTLWRSKRPPKQKSSSDCEIVFVSGKSPGGRLRKLQAVACTTCVVFGVEAHTTPIDHAALLQRHE